MNEHDKYLALAKIMDWELEGLSGHGDTFNVIKDSSLDYNFICRESFFYLPRLEPYARSEEGLAQFAAILLKFPEVMLIWQRYLDDTGSMVFIKEPTQANILDEILKMEGIDI